MNMQMVSADSRVDYSTKEVGPIILAAAIVMVMGGAVAAALIVCGWRGVRSITSSWFHGKIAIVCK